MHVGQACEGFIRFCEVVRKLSPHTIRAYRLDLKRFASFMGIQSSIGECSRTTLHAYVEQLFSVHSLKAASAKRHLASLRSMFRWLEAEGEIPEDPFQRTRINIRMPKRLPRVLSRQDLSLLLHQQPDGDFNDLTAYVAVELLFATGVRIAELAGLRDEDLDLQSGVITVIGKGDRQRRVYVPDAEVRELLIRYRSLRQQRGTHASAFLTNSRGTSASPQFLRRVIRKLADRAHIGRRVTPHMFRHSLATYLLEEEWIFDTCSVFWAIAAS